MTRICIVPRVDGIGGMASFRSKFESGLKTRGMDITHDLRGPSDAVLVIAGTKDLFPLSRARARGLRIVQRLDGINWVHRKRRTGLRHFMRAEYGNFVLSLIRSRISTHILYQSEFCHHWWDDCYGRSQVPHSVVHNGVDLDLFHPQAESGHLSGRCRLLIVEGNLGGGYEMGLDNAIELAEILAQKYGFSMELMVVGRISNAHKASVEARAHVPILWAGVLSREKIPEIDRSAHLLFSADLNPACPNSVLEALACGLPVVSFDTGAMKELVQGDSGRLVTYGGNPWKLDKADIPALAGAAAEILHDEPHFRKAARARAEKAFGLDKMVDGYLQALLE